MRKYIFLTFLLTFLFSLVKANECKNLYPIKHMANYTFGLFLIDRLGYTVEDEDNLMYEITSWYGGDYNRIWFEAEGNHNLNGNGGEIEDFSIYYGHWIKPFWDGRIGLTYIGKYGNNDNFSRTGLAISLKGLAPYMFETDLNVKILTTGELLSDVELEYLILITQKLVIQPKFSIMYSSQNIKEMHIGAGINKIGFSVRLLYEIKREFAPYIEFSHTNYFGNTKDFIKEEIGKDKESKVYIGLRLWF